MNEKLFTKLDEAIQWLDNNVDWHKKIQLRKRPTEQRGQIPADFGRK